MNAEIKLDTAERERQAKELYKALSTPEANRKLKEVLYANKGELTNKGSELYKALKSYQADIQEMILAEVRYRKADKAFRRYERKAAGRIIGKFLTKPKHRGKNSDKDTMGVQKSWLEREHEERTGEPTVMA